jgi:hypothetical protein
MVWFFEEKWYEFDVTLAEKAAAIKAEEKTQRTTNLVAQSLAQPKGQSLSQPVGHSLYQPMGQSAVQRQGQGEHYIT